MVRQFRWVGTASLAVSLTLGVGGCDRGKPASPQKSEGPVVAVVGDGNITQQEFEAKLAEQPAFVRTRYASQEKKREFLDNLVRFELLVQEARRRGMDSDPEVLAMLEKVMVQRLVKAHTESSEDATVSDERAHAYYEANLAEFVKPARVRVSQLLLKAPRGSPERAKALAQATRLSEDIQRGGSVQQAFDAAVRTHSQDTTTQAQGGDLGFRTRDELSASGGATLADAAFTLKAVGQLSSPIETDAGVHLLMLQARQVGIEQKFDQVKGRIVQRLDSERRAKALDTLVQSLRDKTKVEIKEDVLTGVNPEALGTSTLAAPKESEARRP
ncbi:peptidylprolyl isomerase [Myxococcus sp. AM009]|uniref:peptidylprolyl isomerase n=1 Tax=Myxococcus sp. AM009 TaxID=2745137 RepID=UPI0015960CD3|nr:peptidylprolyl isomerase [Myxococcus sp. AM009]NVI98764.1 peptidylprolyl isomerase [Myxococcus sp. AM009]